MSRKWWKDTFKSLKTSLRLVLQFYLKWFLLVWSSFLLHHIWPLAIFIILKTYSEIVWKEKHIGNSDLPSALKWAIIHIKCKGSWSFDIVSHWSPSFDQVAHWWNSFKILLWVIKSWNLSGSWPEIISFIRFYAMIALTFLVNSGILSQSLHFFQRSALIYFIRFITISIQFIIIAFDS